MIYFSHDEYTGNNKGSPSINKSHGGSAAARRTRTIKVSGSNPAPVKKPAPHETIFHVLTFTVVSVVRNPLETVGPVVGAVASSNYL